MTFLLFSHLSRFKVLLLKAQIDLLHLNDIELLELLCSEDEDIVYNEFVNRFYKIVETECLLKCKKRKIDSHVGQQILHETFERVRKYRSFKRENLKIKDPRRAVKTYVYSILSNLFYDYHNQVNKPIISHDFYFNDFKAKLDKINPERLKEIKDLSEFIFKKLNFKEKEVILTDLETKKHRKYLSSDTTECLAKRLKVKNATIRKIRERAIHKINEAINNLNE